jgi:proteasome assembly chaperone (PAC2) family protein
MIMDSVEFYREPPANLTTMVVGFGGWVNAGRAATGAIRHLVRHLSASHLASLDPEAFFIFTQQRPDIRMTPEGHRAIRWPSSEFFTWQPPDGRAGLLLFWGREPHQRWRTYSQTLLDVAEQCGVKRIVSLGAVLAGAPHSRPPRVTGRSTDPEWQAQLEEWGIYRRPSYEGPTGISTVVLEAASQRGFASLSFSGQAPHYVQGRENPAVIQALLSYVTRLLGLGLDVSQFDTAVKAFCSQCDRAVAGDPSIQAHVRDLEQDYDSTDDEGPRMLHDDDLNPDQLMQEVEDFLREDRESGGEV